MPKFRKGMCQICKKLAAKWEIRVGSTPLLVCDTCVKVYKHVIVVPYNTPIPKPISERTAYDFPRPGTIPIMSKYAPNRIEYLPPWDHYNQERWIQFLNIEIHIFGVWP